MLLDHFDKLSLKFKIITLFSVCMFFIEFTALSLFILFISLVYFIVMQVYFNSENFNNIKSTISAHVLECNQLNQHIQDLREVDFRHKFHLIEGQSTLYDASAYNMSRPHLSLNIQDPFVYLCSRDVCAKSFQRPLEYLCKYFNIEIAEESLIYLESCLNNYLAAEEGKNLLIKDRISIINSVSSDIPWIISKLSGARLSRELGFFDIDLSEISFPVFSFRHVSSGGYASMRNDIVLDLNNWAALIDFIYNKLKTRSSIKYQRSLMTPSLREAIKLRDGFSCKICNNSTQKEPNLLLEIDHIVPVSKGGLTQETNLQTLCWKCNRAKSNKIL